MSLDRWKVSDEMGDEVEKLISSIVAKPRQCVNQLIGSEELQKRSRRILRTDSGFLLARKAFKEGREGPVSD